MPVCCLITGEDWSKAVVEPLGGNVIVRDKSNKDSTYFYADFDDKKTRIIVLDAYHYPVEANENGYAEYVAESWAKLSDRQVKWFAETALDTSKEDWIFIITIRIPECSFWFRAMLR